MGMIRLKTNAFYALFALAILFLGVVLPIWVVQRADREMRADFLRQAELVAGGLSAKMLNGMELIPHDVGTAKYEELKGVLMRGAASLPEAKWIYLMERKGKEIYLLMDNLHPEEPDFNYPGTIYQNPTERMVKIFDGGEAFVEGPYWDEKGRWVSAIVPIKDALTGKVVGILGVDIEGKKWGWKVVNRLALPAGLTIVLLILVVAIVGVSREEIKPIRLVRKKLFVPLLVMVGVFLGLMFWLFWTLHEEREEAKHVFLRKGIEVQVRDFLLEERKSLEKGAGELAKDRSVGEALWVGDRESLEKIWADEYERMRGERKNLHIAFYDRDRECVFRDGEMQARGGVALCEDGKKLVRLHLFVSGEEEGLLGLVFFRVVEPVFLWGELVGYVEMGERMDRIFEQVHRRFGVGVAVGMPEEQGSGEGGDAGRVLVYVSEAGLEKGVAEVEKVLRGRGYPLQEVEVEWEGKSWEVVELDFSNVGEKKGVKGWIFFDDSEEDAQFYRFLIFAGVVAGVFGFGVLAFAYVLLTRTDKAILDREEQMRRSNVFLELLLKTLPVPVFYKGLDGRYLGMNRAFEEFFGKRKEDLLGKTVSDICAPEDAKKFGAKDQELYKSKGTQVFETALVRPDGEERTVIFYKSCLVGREEKRRDLWGWCLT